MSSIAIYRPVYRGENIGYGAAGASRTRRALKGFIARSISAREDIDSHNYTMRQRGRLMYMSAPLATSAINTNRTNVIGVGLKLRSRINRAILGLTQEQAAQWEKKTEAEFALWASNKRNCDATGVNDFYGMQQLAFLSWLISGDSFALIKYKDRTLMQPYGLRLHIIEADRISTPEDQREGYPFGTNGKTSGGNEVFDGVEIDRNGAIIAYHICDRYPYQFLSDPMPKWERVEAYGAKTGLPNILHMMSSERAEQYRGVSYLAPIIEPLLQIKRFTDSELTAAVVASLFTVFVKFNTPANDNPMSGTNQYDQVSRDPDDYEMGSGNINFMEPGEDIQIVESKRPSTGFGEFVKAVAEQLGAALEVPGDLILKAFNSSYSASRGVLMEAWKSFRTKREWFTGDFCKPTYEIFLSEAVGLGRINAPGFFNDPILRAAWLGSEWIGPSQGQIDPVKEVSAYTKAIDYGLLTHEQATVQYSGGNWDSNIEQLEVENRLRAQAFGGQLPPETGDISHLIDNEEKEGAGE